MSLVSTLRGRWAAVALVLSLVLNGFLVGLLATDALRKDHGSRGPRYVSFELRRLAEHLPRDAVDQIAAELAPLAPVMEARIERFRGMRAEIARLAASPEPDRAAIDERLARLRAEATAMQEEAQRATYDALLKLPAESRAPLAAAPPER